VASVGTLMDAGLETVEAETPPPAARVSARPSPGRDARGFLIDTGVVALTQLLMKLRGVVTLPLIAKMLGTAQYGIWAQVLAFVTLAAAICNGNLHLPLIRFIAEDRKNQARIYTTLLLATAALGAAGAAAVFLFRNTWSDLLFPGGEMLPYLVVVALLILFGNLRVLNVNLYRATGRLKLRSIMELGASLGELVGICALLASGYTLLHVLAFMAAWQAAVALLQMFHGRSIVGWAKPDWSILKAALRYALPLLPVALSGWALDRSDRLIISAYLGPRAVGIYSANYALAGMVMLFQAPLQMTLFPKVAQYWASDRERAYRYIGASTRFFLLLAIPFTIGVAVLAPPLLLHLGNREIAEASGWTTFYIATGVTLWGLSIMQSQAFHGAKRTGTLGGASMAAAVLNVALTYLLVPRYGIAAAAASTLVAFAALCTFLGLRGRALLPRGLVGGYVLKAYAAALLMGAYLAWLGPVSLPAIVLAAASGALLYAVVVALLRPLAPDEQQWLRAALASALRQARGFAARRRGPSRPAAQARSA
jgi:O-antigen/teichoic acid export membrane protein